MRPSVRWDWLAVGLAAAASFALAASAARAKSSTYDEGAHLVAGYSYWTTGRYVLNLEHPPLAKLWAAAPLLALQARLPAAPERWSYPEQWWYGRQFLYRWNDADLVLFAARLPMAAAAALLPCAVFLWARRHWGRPAALLALALAAFDPGVLGHGPLVTTDVPLALFFFLAVAALERLAERPTGGRAVLAGLALGAALVTKFSAAALLPIGAALAVAVVSSRAMQADAPKYEWAAFGIRARVVFAVAFALAGLVALAVIWAVYGLSDAHGAALPWELVAPPGTARFALAPLRALLPDTWAFGLLLAWQTTRIKPAYLLGQVSLTGWWYYFPVAFLLKTTLPLLLLLGLALATWRRHRSSARAEAFLLLPVLVYAALAILQGFNIGHRHLFPIYAFLWVIAGRCASLGWGPRAAGERRERTFARLAVAALAAWHVAGAVKIHPHHLAFFNEAAGGPANGYRLLVDSNLDWGQDLGGLRRYMAEHAIERVKLSYFGTADPDYHGVAHDLLPSATGVPQPAPAVVRPGDWLAVSATNLQGLYLPPWSRSLIAQLKRLEPVGHVGYSILVYRSDFTWDPPARSGP